MNKEMYHPSSKRKELIARTLTYSLMVLSIITLVVVSLFYTLGYRFDTKDKKLELSALVQFVTSPSGATVEIDGVTHSQITPTKETVAAGSHEFVMWRDGYETWRKTVTVQSGTLTWLNYTRLVPKARPVESVVTLPNLAQSLASPDKRFMATVPDATKPTLAFYNLSADKITEATLSIPAEAYTDASTQDVTHHFEIDQWDQGSRYLLVKHVYGDKNEWLVVDRQDNKVVSNITRTFDTDITSAYFGDNNATVLYARIGDDIRKVNLANETISAPLISHVAEFELYGDVIAYVLAPDKTTGKRVAGIVKDGEEPVELYRTSSLEQVPVHIRVTNYFNKDYAVISDGGNVQVYSGTFPDAQSERSRLKATNSFTFPSDIAWLQLSPSGRFVLAQNAASYASYDLERAELSPVATLAGTTEPRVLKWLDDYYVWSDRSDMLTMREFDGANQHAINTVAAGFDIALSQNGRWLYSIGKRADGHLQLQRVRMILP
ncbi:MAG: hypothetical protein JWO61_154 [Candidatus Saccharibacteria bacterium]|nr:hypothetical protein [Candidatus Saccharibacteria bacterium]